MSRTLSVSAVGILLALCIGGSACAAEQRPFDKRYFNAYMIRAYKKLKVERADLGYYKDGYFTKNLDYGDQKGVIYASGKEPNKIMCNAAVTETLIEAINLYAADSKGAWSPQDIIPARSWNSVKWSDLKLHLFANDYRDRSTAVQEIEQEWEEIPRGLKKDIDDFHSLNAMSIALENFGLGERDIKFEEARAGDVVTFDRKQGTGHSVIFLSFLTLDLKEVSKYSPKVVGFKYFSSQKITNGLGERWAFFDRSDYDRAKAKFPAVDCCVIRVDLSKKVMGPRVGRVWAPRRWTFARKQAEVRRKEKQLETHVKEYMETRASNGEVLKLLASAAIAMQKKNPQQRIAAYVKQLQSKFHKDLRDIAQESDPPNISTQKLLDIYRITPRSVIKLANELAPAKDDLQRRVQMRTAERIKLLEESGGTHNSRLDDQSSN